MAGLDALERLHAVDARHDQIHKHQVHMGLLHLSQGGLAVPCLQNAVPGFLQVSGKHQAVGRLIVHD